MSGPRRRGEAEAPLGGLPGDGDGETVFSGQLEKSHDLTG